MLYLNNQHLIQLGINWVRVIDTIEECVAVLKSNDFAQPVKPYLRYRDPKNRIISMPAFVGGNINISGIKWIASFPENLKLAIPRAHSVTILNNADNGIPICILNTPMVSGIRTAAVSGFIIKKILCELDSKRNGLVIAIIGFGPIGKLHFEMVTDILRGKIEVIRIFDLAGVDTKTIPNSGEKIEIVKSWQEAYQEADIVITCTVSKQPYIDLAPKHGSLHLNVSLRDYKDNFLDFTDHIIVDDWDEVCREATDIERMHMNKGLTKDRTTSIIQLEEELHHSIRQDDVVMFNPMGMAVFDMAIGNYYRLLAESKKIYQQLD